MRIVRLLSENRVQNGAKRSEGDAGKSFLYVDQPTSLRSRSPTSTDLKSRSGNRSEGSTPS